MTLMVQLLCSRASSIRRDPMPDILFSHSYQRRQNGCCAERLGAIVSTTHRGLVQLSCLRLGAIILLSYSMHRGWGQLFCSYTFLYPQRLGAVVLLSYSVHRGFWRLFCSGSVHAWLVSCLVGWSVDWLVGW